MLMMMKAESLLSASNNQDRQTEEKKELVKEKDS